MADGGYLAPLSQESSRKKIWVETRKRLERFLPTLFAELFPEAPKPSQGSSDVISGQSPNVATKDADSTEDDREEIQTGSPTILKEDTHPSSPSDVDWVPTLSYGPFIFFFYGWENGKRKSPKNDCKMAFFLLLLLLRAADTTVLCSRGSQLDIRSWTLCIIRQLEMLPCVPAILYAPLKLFLG